jgi:predicted DNA-binding transcriptional regulator AlpA
LKIKDVAAITQLSEGTIRKYILHETIPFIKLDTSIRFDPVVIDHWINARSKVNEKYKTVMMTS